MTFTTPELVMVGSMVATVSIWGTGILFSQRNTNSKLDDLTGEFRRMNGSLRDHLAGHPMPTELTAKTEMDLRQKRADETHAELKEMIRDVAHDLEQSQNRASQLHSGSQEGGAR